MWLVLERRAERSALMAIASPLERTSSHAANLSASARASVGRLSKAHLVNEAELAKVATLPRKS